MDNINYRGIPTSLFLNGPKLGIVTDPQSQTSTTGFATFTGIATASFPNPTDGVNDGSIEFKWYFDGSQILDISEDGASSALIVGFSSATGTGSTITIYDLSLDDNNKEVYFTADYIPSAYSQPVGSAVIAGTARSTGNAYNEPLQSSSALLGVESQIIITKQPEDAFVSVNQDAEFSIEATAPTNISYQWQLNGIDLVDGTTTGSVIQLVGASGDGVPVCISVIDECSRSQSVMDSAWSAFRNSFPQRRFYLLQPSGYEPPRLKIPTAYDSDALANAPISVTRDNGDSGLTSDWFELCQLDTVPSGTTISLSIDNSGSMTTPQVQASLSLFETKCSNAGLVLNTLNMESSENWVLDHNRDLPTTTSENKELKITNNANSEVFTLDLTTDVVYDSFVPGITYTLVPNDDISVKLFATGGGGGRAISGSGNFNPRSTASGGTGGTSEGKFTFVKDQKYQLVVGGAGVSGLSGGNGTLFPRSGAGGFSGGGDGTLDSGSSTGNTSIPGLGGGGGGGFTGLFTDSITIENAIIIAGGGGGGANNIGFSGGSGGNLIGRDGENQFTGSGGHGGGQDSGGLSAGSGSSAGTALQGGKGHAGGGGGYYGGSGGAVKIRVDGGGGDVFQSGAGGGGSAYIGGVIDGTTAYVNRDTPADGVDGSFRIELDGPDANSQLTVSGATTPNLKILSSFPNIFGILKCKLTASKVTNSPLFSRATEFVVVSARDMLGIETYNYTNATATIEYVDLAAGGLSLSHDSHTGNAICLYASEKDIDVEVTMYGGIGVEVMSTGIPGGEGGLSTIRFTMKKDDEYILTGLFNAVNAPFLYRKGTLIAVVGEGGSSARTNFGGKGGGINIAGERGEGATGGSGGPLIEAGTLPSSGIFGDRSRSTTAVTPDTKRTDLVNGEYLGGRTLPCPRGDYWRDQGKSPCEDLGTIKFRTPDGTEISNTAEIDRGYKSGYNIIQTSSGSLGGSSVRSGSGATGGASGRNSTGGGGGSGYTDGSVDVIRTQLGGSTEPAKIDIRIAPPITPEPIATVTSGTLSHTFNNASDTNTNFQFTGAIINAVSASPGAADQSFDRSINQKHYVITMNSPYSNITVSGVSVATAGGGTGNNSLVKQERVSGSNTQWRLWFQKSNGFTTYVRGFTVTGIA
jgi:hypothetical protein